MYLNCYDKHNSVYLNFKGLHCILFLFQVRENQKTSEPAYGRCLQDNTDKQTYTQKRYNDGFIAKFGGM